MFIYVYVFMFIFQIIQNSTFLKHGNVVSLDMESYNYYFQESECDTSPLWSVGILFKGQTEYILHIL